MRLRAIFAKTEAMRFTGHLDLHRTWERSLRRATLPLAYSQGFNPHPRINLASALPLGFTSQYEVVDFWLQNELSISEIQKVLERALPPGIKLRSVQAVDPRAATLQTVLEAADYYVTFLTPLPDLDERLRTLLAAKEIPRQRRGKAYDLRPLILAAVVLPENDQGLQQIDLRLAAREGATGRPEEVIAVLGGKHEDTRVHRTRLVFKPGEPGLNV